MTSPGERMWSATNDNGLPVPPFSSLPGNERAEWERAALDLDGVEARANAATPGPWEADSHSVGAGEYWVAHIPGYDPGEGSGNPEASADAEHIAGMDPATTLALVAEVRALRAKVEASEKVEDSLMAASYEMAGWEARGHVPSCGPGAAPCERCAKAAAAQNLRSILGSALSPVRVS